MKYHWCACQHGHSKVYVLGIYHGLWLYPELYGSFILVGIWLIIWAPTNKHTVWHDGDKHWATDGHFTANTEQPKQESSVHMAGLPTGQIEPDH